MHRRFLIVDHRGGFDMIWGRAWTRKGAERRIDAQRGWVERANARLARLTAPGGRAVPGRAPLPLTIHELTKE